VGDEDRRETELAAQILYLLENLALVTTSSAVVGSSMMMSRDRGERHGDHHPLRMPPESWWGSCAADPCSPRQARAARGPLALALRSCAGVRLQESVSWVRCL